MTEASHKTTQYWSVALKVLVLVLAFGYIGHKLNTQGSLLMPILGESFNDVSLATLLIVMGLTICNWLLEILKWKVSVNTAYPLKFATAAKQSLGSLTASIITPNRIGEYGAKALYYPVAHRKKILFLNFVHSSSQMAATLLYGIPAFIYFVFTYRVGIATERLLLLALFLVSLLGMGYLYRKKQLGIKGLSLQNIWTHFDAIAITKRMSILFLSLLRYSVFSLLFYLLLKFYGVENNFTELAPVIFSMYLLVSVVPSFFVVDVVIRGSVAIWLFSFLGISEMAVLATVFSMWLLNAVLPSVVGSYYVFTFKSTTV